MYCIIILVLQTEKSKVQRVICFKETESGLELGAPCTLGVTLKYGVTSDSICDAFTCSMTIVASMCQGPPLGPCVLQPFSDVILTAALQSLRGSVLSPSAELI